ncbi:MAG TPA: sugar ABC transporter substrate-binding protein [Thermomicrobiales bacterium]|nr:sugar ABC transporter substrate-binding protein [Thermomicrobiales bacterium]
MGSPRNDGLLRSSMTRRSALGLGAAGLAATALHPSGAFANLLQSTGDTNRAITPEEWTPEHIRQIAGTLEVDTAEAVSKIVPLDHKGKVTFWDVGPNEASPEIQKQMYDEFWAAFKKTYPNIEVDLLNLDYNDMVNKVRTAALGNAAPSVARMTILWIPEFTARGYLEQVDLEEFGYTKDLFWQGALQSVTWDGKIYGIPTNNETMALIWNAAIFDEAGFDPEKPPATWDDVVTYSKQIKDKTGKDGYGLVARPNAGNTPYRYMPVSWAYGGGALDEAEPNPTYKKILINSKGNQAALQAHYDMYVRDKSVPVSALTNTQTENADPFIAGRLAMMISHPSEYAAMVDRANKATGEDKKIADEVVGNMRYGLLPEGPVRRAVVFGGWSIHKFKDEYVSGDHDRDSAKALMAFMTSPEWSTKLWWAQSNPGNLDGFKTKWMKERLEQMKFLDVTTSMLPYGISYPVIPEAAEIMNIIVPDMMQNALTEKMSVAGACEDAAKKIDDLISGL